MTADGGPAFPSAHAGPAASEGLSLRDYFAAAALQGLLAGANHYEVIKHTPEGRLVMPGTVGIPPIAYHYADAMLAERAK
jgi:hypothetical protein